MKPRLLFLFLFFSQLGWAAPAATPLDAHFVDVQTIDLWQPVPEQLYVQTMLGTLVNDGSTPGARLNGLVFRYVNDWQGPTDPTDNARVRAIIGEVINKGSGSVRFAHGHALAQGTSTGPLSVFAATVSPLPTTSSARAIDVASAGAPGKVDGIHFAQAPGSDFLRGISFLNARFTKSAIDLPTSPTSGLRWCVPDGRCVAGLWVDTEGTIHLVGTALVLDSSFP